MNIPPERLLDTLIPRRWGSDNQPRTVHSQDHVVQGELSELKERQWDLDCLAINLPWGVHELIDRRCEYFAVLRDPVDRVLSLWSDAYRNRQDSQLWQSWERLGLDLARILDSPCGTALSNDQVRMLTGSRQRALGHADVERAMTNVTATLCEVGVFGDLAGFAARVGHRYGWTASPLRHLNRGDQRGLDLLAPGDLDLLAAANRYDALLYEWCAANAGPLAEG